jgi:hypothetical protein
MNWKECGWKRPWPNIIYCTGICLDGLRKTTKTCQNSRSPDRDSNAGASEYKIGMLTTRPRSLALVTIVCNSLLVMLVMFGYAGGYLWSTSRGQRSSSSDYDIGLLQ